MRRPPPGSLSEKHSGIVTDNNDPEKRGRLRIKSQAFVDADSELPDWVEPADPAFTSIGGGGALFLPRIGSTVQLEASTHDFQFDERLGERFLQNPSFRWSHAVPTTTPQPVPDALKTNYPERRGFVTPAGHKVIMDDGGSIIIEAKAGSRIEMYPDGSVAVLSSNVQLGANNLVLPGDGVVLGSHIDSFTGKPVWQLGGASTVVKARKL